MLSPGIQTAMQKVPFCDVPNNGSHISGLLVPTDFKFDCGKAVGYLAVYRLCFAMTVFFSIMALLMIGVKSSKDPRAGIQNG